MARAQFISGGRFLVHVGEDGSTEIVEVASGLHRSALPARTNVHVRGRENVAIAEDAVAILDREGAVHRGDLTSGEWQRALTAPAYGRIRRARLAIRGPMVAVSYERQFDYKADNAHLLFRNDRKLIEIPLGTWIEVLDLRITADRIECILVSHGEVHARFVSFDYEGCAREEMPVIPPVGEVHAARFFGRSEFVVVSGGGEGAYVSLHSLAHMRGHLIYRCAQEATRFERTFDVRRTPDGRLQLAVFNGGKVELLTIEGGATIARESMAADCVYRAALAQDSEEIYLDAIVKSDSDIRELADRRAMCVVPNSEAAKNEPMAPSSYFPPRRSYR